MKNVLLVCLVLALAGCNIQNEAVTAYANITSERIWVFSQFNVPAEDDSLESYYYYGSISEDLYNAIGDNVVKDGFIKLNDISYWGNNDLIYDYKDSEHSGSRIFRIEHIASMRQVPNRPISGKGAEQFEEVESTNSPAALTELESELETQ
jgi:hypothetical protein